MAISTSGVGGSAAGIQRVPWPVGLSQVFAETHLCALRCAFLIQGLELEGVVTEAGGG